MNLFVKTNNFQLVFHFEKTRTIAIFGEYGMIYHDGCMSQSEL